MPTPYRSIRQAFRGGSALHYAGRLFTQYQAIVQQSSIAGGKQYDRSAQTQTVLTQQVSSFSQVGPYAFLPSIIIVDTPTKATKAEGNTTISLIDPVPTVTVESSTTAEFKEDAVSSYEEGTHNRGNA